ncbi:MULTISPECIES: hypothetical protein [Pseudomonas syringae group]|uniref:hypothetical protein n=1 Tax=Pseudomonas syringae group TaxID=136849 RepID=UPI0006D64E13|nr:hypothetical protein [Pseudomonas coronafaciens]
MRREKSGWKVMLNMLTRPKGLLAAVITLPLMVAPSVSSAKDGMLSLHGSIVNSSCKVSRPDGHAAAARTRMLEVAPGINVYVSTDGNACTAYAVPFVAYYQVLPDTLKPDGTSSQGRAAVITLNYQ